METGKTAKYLKYAIGEIILVMIGILLALQVNNWNEQRKEKQTRRVLIASLIEDFEGTQEILSRATFEADSLFNNMNTFYALTASDQQIVSVDSLRTLARSFFRTIRFESILSTYNEAQANGNLSLLKSNAFIESMTSFNRNNKGFIEASSISSNNFYSGAMWDLRKTLGSSSVLIKTTFIPEKNKLKSSISYSKYFSIISSPLGEAALENQYVLMRNIKIGLSNIDNALQDLIAILKTLQEEK